MKKATKIAIAATGAGLFLVLAAFIAGMAFFRAVDSALEETAATMEEAAITARLRHIAEEQSELLPRKIDSITRLDAVSTGDRQLIFKYSLARRPAQPIAGAARRLKRVAADKACSTLRELLDQGVSLVSRYYGPDAEFLAEFEVSSADCR